jgi:hypothetical protein
MSSFKLMLFSLSVPCLALLRIGRLVGVLSLPFQAWNLSTLISSSTSVEEYPLRELPGLNASEEEDRRDENNGPLPRDHLVLEDHMVDDRDVKGRKDGDEAEDDGPEEESVTANVIDPGFLVSNLLDLPMFHTS